MAVDYLDMAMEVDDWEALSNYLENGYPLTDKLRAYIVGVLRGKKRLKKRPTKISTEMRRLEVRDFLSELERNGIKRTEAKLRAAEKFGIDPRTVERLDRFRSFTL